MEGSAVANVPIIACSGSVRDDRVLNVVVTVVDGGEDARSKVEARTSIELRLSSDGPTRNGCEDSVGNESGSTILVDVKAVEGGRRSSSVDDGVGCRACDGDVCAC